MNVEPRRTSRVYGTEGRSSCYSLTKNFKSANDPVESLLQVARDVSTQIAQTTSEGDQVACLARRTAGDSEKVCIVLVRRPRRAFHNVAGNRYTGAPKLNLQSVAFFSRERAWHAIDINRELIGHLEHVKFLKVVAHAAASCNEQAWASLEGMMSWIVFVAGAVLSWGLYGASLHRGQVLLGNPLKALLCVGIAYVLIAVFVPVGALTSQNELRGFNAAGAMTATVAGALGALGAVCIIYSFRAGASPLYVMPLVFGGAPLVNVLATLAIHPPKIAPNPMLYLGFVLAAVGAGMVLYYRPTA